MSLKQHDRFFTKTDIANKCINTLASIVNLQNIKTYLEPSVGKVLLLKH